MQNTTYRGFASCNCDVTGFGVVMNIVLSQTKCPSCGNRLIRTPDVGGDYYETVIGFTLQQYCNNNCNMNGVMRPELDGRDPNFISNRGKLAFAVRVAHVFRLGITETKNVARSLNTNNLDDFIHSFCKKICIPKSDALLFSG